MRRKVGKGRRVEEGTSKIKGMKKNREEMDRIR